MYNRILLKLSGALFTKTNQKGIDYETLYSVAVQIKEILKTGVQISIVVGGGNFWKRKENTGLETVCSDNIGMLATIMNALALQDVLEKNGVKSIVQSDVHIPKITTQNDYKTNNELLEKDTIIIFAGGMSNPFFKTDTAAIIRALETKSDIVMLAKKIDAIYTKNPNTYSDAKKIEKITYDQVLEKQMHVIEEQAILLAKEWKIPIKIFGIKEENSILKAVVTDTKIGTLIN
ncbi:MAG: uridine monophosphate kinase [Clostridium sp.]